MALSDSQLRKLSDKALMKRATSASEKAFYWRQEEKSIPMEPWDESDREYVSEYIDIRKNAAKWRELAYRLNEEVNRRNPG